MSHESTAMRGKLAELKADKFKLATRFQADAKAAKQGWALLSVSPIKEIDVDSILVHTNQAAETKHEYLEVCGKIEQLEKELA